MANKKVWAYAIDEKGKYLKGEKHPLKIFYIWDALKLKNNKIHEFNKLKFMSTSQDPAFRSEMFAVKNGFYRHQKGTKQNEKFDKDGNSLSHSIAIQVLSEMDKIHFVCGKKEHTLDVENIRTDDLKLQLTRRGRFDYYYPDLICFFNNPKNLALKWGNKLAIEVCHTHACEDEKRQDFENHGIPIIEVNIQKISIEKKFNTKSPTPEQLEQYYLYLKRAFGNQVYGKIISDPVSINHFRRKRREFTQQIEENQAKLNVASRIIDKLVTKNKSNTKEIEKLKNIITLNNKKITEKEEKILTIEKRGVFYNIAKALRFIR